MIMNKKRFFAFMPALALAACVCTFTSCSDDDENGSAPSGPTTTFEGKLLTQVGNYEFDYDNNGRCTSVSSTYGEYVKIDYAKNKITLDDGDQEMSVSFNSKGYITKMSGSWNENYEGESYKGNGSISFGYDGNGHMTEQNSSSKETGSYDGESYSFSGTSTVSCKWNGGNLVSATARYDENEDGEKSWYSEDYTATYDETLNNKAKQFPMVFTDLFGDDMYLLALVGMFGVGPTSMPAKVVCTEKDNYGSNSEYETTVTFDLNADGTINWERLNGTTYNYSYMGYSSSGDEEVPVTPAMMAANACKKKLSVRNIFMRNFNRK